MLHPNSNLWTVEGTEFLKCYVKDIEKKSHDFVVKLRGLVFQAGDWGSIPQWSFGFFSSPEPLMTLKN